MIETARCFHARAPNIAVKLPVTAAGLDVLEECVAQGITVPQVLAVAERHSRGVTRARAGGIEPGRCFAVIMIGRIDRIEAKAGIDNKKPTAARSAPRGKGLRISQD